MWAERRIVFSIKSDCTYSYHYAAQGQIVRQWLRVIAAEGLVLLQHWPAQPSLKRVPNSVTFGGACAPYKFDARNLK